MEKRRTSMYLPYKILDGKVSVFLQRRGPEVERNPGGLSVFGGGLEGGESYKEALVREVREEFGATPGSKVIEIGDFEDQWSISKYFAEEVRDDFDTTIKINEGECGVWAQANEVIEMSEVSDNTKKVVTKLIMSC